MSLVVVVLTYQLNTYAQSCPGAAGCLDPTFGSGGVASYMIDPGSLTTSDMAAQEDGKIVATVGGHKIIRLNSDGSLDASFGSGGIVDFVWSFTSGSTTYYGSGYELAIQRVSDGTERIVVAGTGHLLSGRKVVSGLQVGRFMPDGTVDTSFGTNGTVVVQGGNANHVRVQNDGKILTITGPGVLTRLTPNGSLDTSFGNGGSLDAGTGNSTEIGHLTDFALDVNGAIVVSGDVTVGKGNSAHTVITVKRYDSSGVRDMNFGTSGTARADYGTSAFTGEVAFDALQNIVIRCGVTRAGTTSRYFAVARFTPNGLTDTSFAGTGKVTFLGGTGSRAGIFFASDGGMILSGQLNADYGLVKYRYNGTLDSSFGNGGSVIMNIDGEDRVADGVMQTDPYCACSKIVMGSNAGSSPSNNTFARFIFQ
jgi:uncharacterized delta-60 repeat protein